MAENMIIPIESRSFAYEQSIGFFRCSYESYDYSFALTAGQTYTVTWEGTPFVLDAFESVFDDANIIAIGNEAYITGQSATPTEPFAFIYDTSAKVTTIAALDTEPAHTFGLSLGEQEMEPEPEDGVVLLDYKDESRTYTDVEMVRVPSTTEGEMVRYVREDLIPEVVEKTLEQDELDFSGGPIEVLPGLGQAFSKISIPVPDGLESGNIAEGVTVAGIPGSHKGGGGGGKVAFGKIEADTSAPLTIEHGLGIIPDLVLVLYGEGMTPKASSIIYLSGASGAFLAKARVPNVYAYTSASSSSPVAKVNNFGASSIVGGSGIFGISGATESTFTAFASTSSYLRKGMVWLAFAGLV